MVPSGTPASAGLANVESELYRATLLQAKQAALGVLAIVLAAADWAQCTISYTHFLLTVYRRRVILSIVYRKDMTMAAEPADLLPGTLDLLILKAVSLGPLHGLGISRRIEQLTVGTFQVKPGSLFPALHRMEAQSWLAAEWGESEANRRAKYYRLTKAGRRQLETETKRWDRVAIAIGSALEAK